MTNPISFKDPWILLLIPFLWATGIWFVKKSIPAAVKFPSMALFSQLKSTIKTALSKNLYLLRLIILSLFFIALAGPRNILEQVEVLSEGIDIVLAVDASGSMSAEDFRIDGKRVNRLKIVKNVVEEFIENRSGDRIGLVAFAGRAYTVCPLTTDYDWVIENLKRVELGLIREDGTAIGSAVASALSRLEDSTAESKVIILLTDGVNNAGTIDPLKAADAASALGVKIYTIGAGSDGKVPYPVQFFGRTVYQSMQVEIDEQTLQEMVQKTEGKYFRATDTESLKTIYATIDELEKVEIKQTGYKEYKQLFGTVLLVALALLVIELTLANTILIKIP